MFLKSISYCVEETWTLHKSFLCVTLIVKMYDKIICTVKYLWWKCLRYKILFIKLFMKRLKISQILTRTDFLSWTKVKTLISRMCTSKIRFKVFNITVWCSRAPRINWEDGRTIFSARSWQRALSLAVLFFLSLSQ